MVKTFFVDRSKKKNRPRLSSPLPSSGAERFLLRRGEVALGGGRHGGSLALRFAALNPALLPKTGEG